MFPVQVSATTIQLGASRGIHPLPCLSPHLIPHNFRQFCLLNISVLSRIHHMTSGPVFPISYGRFIFLTGLIICSTHPTSILFTQEPEWPFSDSNFILLSYLSPSDAAASIQNKPPRNDIQGPSQSGPCINF